MRPQRDEVAPGPLPASAGPPPRQLPQSVRDTWAHLGGAPARRTEVARFDPSALDGLPTAVRRWLRHALEPGAPLATTALLRMHGEIKVSRWMPFTARQVLAPDGFIWAAVAGGFPMRISGFDRWSDGTGQMRWKLLGVVPVMTADGPDTDRSAAGRLAGETMLVPAGALGENVDWHGDDGEPDDGSTGRATATVHAGGFTHRVTVEVDHDGALRSVSLPRWGDPDGEGHREEIFGVAMDGSLRVGGQVLPTELRASWWFGSDRQADGEFFRATLDSVQLI